MENKSKSKIALGVILGVAAGAAVYYFMTSENGKQQLSDVIDSVKDFADKTKLNGEKLAKRAGELSSDVVSRAKDVTNELAKKANEVKSELENS